MSLQASLNKRIRARVEDDDSEDAFSEPDSGSDASDLEDDDDSDAASPAESDIDDEEEEEDAEQNQDLSSITQISFGALAKAQDSLPSTKRKRRNTNQEEDDDDKPSPLEDIRSRIRAARDEKSKANTTNKPTHEREKRAPLPHRSSKHAPTVQSSKHAVSRRRTVVETAPVPKARDPRFDSLVTSGTANPALQTQAQMSANKNYAFLSEYRASELSALKAQLAKSKNADEKVRLKREISSLGDKMRAHEAKMREREIRAEHKRRERELIREGKKSAPWFLKKGDVKREMLKERYEGMGAREKKKSVERRRKKLAARERRDMPDFRRGVE